MLTLSILLFLFFLELGEYVLNKLGSFKEVGGFSL